MTSITLSGDARDRILQHASATYPNECCGALLGVADVAGTALVIDMLPLPNTTEEGPRRRFLVRPSDYRAAEAHADATGADLLGFYHSHPDHPARPSEYDLAHAWPNLSYVIVAVAGGRPADLRSWRLYDDRSAFGEEPVRT